MYGQIENGKVVKIFNSKPEWYYDNGIIIKDEDLLKENIFPIDTLFNRAVDFEKERLVVNDLNSMILDYKQKKIVNYFKAEPFTLEEVYQSKVRDLELTKNQRTYVNLKYTFPDHKVGIIQLRNEQDLNTINTLFADAMYVIMNNKEKTFSFKDESNTSHELTPQQMSDLGSFVQQHVEKIFSEYWNIKHNKLDVIYKNSSKSPSKRIDEIVSLVWK